MESPVIHMALTIMDAADIINTVMTVVTGDKPFLWCKANKFDPP